MLEFGWRKPRCVSFFGAFVESLFLLELPTRLRPGIPASGFERDQPENQGTMSSERQGVVLLAFSVVFLLGAAYKLADVLQWHLRKVEAKGTITAIEGRSVNNPGTTRNGCPQTLHYRYTDPAGQHRDGTDSVWTGDCWHNVGRSLDVYHDHRDAAHSITKTGLDSRRNWAILLAVFSVICFLIGGFIVAPTRHALRSTPT